MGSVIWVAWRQHRHHLSAGCAAVALLAVVYVNQRAGLENYLQHSGLKGCLALPDEGCGNLIGGLRAIHPSILQTLPYLNLAPALVGLFWGAPLIAAEVDNGTHRLVWTQAISRSRWLSTKFVMLTIGCVLFGIAAGAADRWFMDPYIRAGAISPVAPNYVALIGVAPAAFALFAFALGTAVGSLVRRTLPAMMITLAIFVPLRLIWEQQRYHFLSPVRVAYSPNAARPTGVSRQDWRTDAATSMIDRTGHPVTDAQIGQWCTNAANSVVKNSGLNDCLAAHGVRQVEWYEPASRFWHLQELDVVVFGTLAVVLLAVAAVRVIRRVN